jgi:hypothetical protein
MPRGRRRKGTNALFKSAEWVGWALGGLEREIEETKSRLQALTAQAATLRNQVGGTVRRGVAAAAGVVADAGAAAPGRRRRGRMTPEGRRRISEMMKKRWADAKKKNKNHL